MVESIFTCALGLVSSGLIPCAIGYIWQISLLKHGIDSAGIVKLRWVILPELAICVLSVAGVTLLPSLEEYCAGIFILALMALICTIALAFGRWAARSDYRRTQRRKIENNI